MGGSFGQRLGAEALGTALLVGTVVGSGIMAERLAGGNDALALLCNTIATGAILVVIITIFAPVSGAHFNPAVTLCSPCAASCPRATSPPTSSCSAPAASPARLSPI
jgi:glycerol uptake facilitator-like aquaporin